MPKGVYEVFMSPISDLMTTVFGAAITPYEFGTVAQLRFEGTWRIKEAEIVMTGGSACTPPEPASIFIIFTADPAVTNRPSAGLLSGTVCLFKPLCWTGDMIFRNVFHIRAEVYRRELRLNYHYLKVMAEKIDPLRGT